MNIDRYGLSAQYDFSVSNTTFSDMDKVIDSLNKIVKMTKSTEKATRGVKIGQQFDKSASAGVKSANKVVATNKKLENSLKEVNKRLRPVKQEFAAITAEARNIEWGDLLQPRKFRAAKKEAGLYILELSKLEKQVTGNTAVERKLVAQLKRKQTVMKGQIELQKKERDAAKASQRIGETQALAAVGKTVFAPLSRVVGNSVQVMADFDDKIAKVRAVSGATAEEMEKLRSSAKRLGATTSFSATQVADAQAFLAMSGMKATEVLISQKAALNLASAGALELGDAADIASNVMSAFNLEAADFERIANVMAKTASTTNTSVSQMGEAFKMAAPLAAQFGTSVEETAALIGMAGNVGLQGTLAGTGARTGFTNLVDAKKQEKLRDNFGVEAISEDGTARNIISIIGDIKESMDTDFRDPKFLKDLQGIERDIANGVEGADGRLKELTKQYPQYAEGLSKLTDVFGKRAIAFWSAQISQYDGLQEQALKTFASGVDDKALAEQLGINKGEDIFKTLIAESKDYETAVATLNEGIVDLVKSGKGGKGAAEAMSKIMEANLAGAFRSLGSAIEGFKIAFVEPMKPLITGIVEAVAKLLRFLTNLPEPIRFLISSGVTLTVGLSGLAVVLGTVGAALFGFSRAASVAAIAQGNLARGAAIPLTGFFQSSMESFTATSPIKTFGSSFDKFSKDFRVAWRKTLGQSITVLKAWGAQATIVMRGVGLASKAILLNPITLWIGAFLILNTVLEKIVPGFNLLGAALGAIAAPFGFIFGLIKGLIKSVLKLIGLSSGNGVGAIAGVFESIGTAISTALKTFILFSEKGEEIGENLGDALLSPIVNAQKMIREGWTRTIDYLKEKLAPFAAFVEQVRDVIVNALGRGGGRGVTATVEKDWSRTADFIQSILSSVTMAVKAVGAAILGGFGGVFQGIKNLWDRSGEKGKTSSASQVTGISEVLSTSEPALKSGYRTSSARIAAIDDRMGERERKHNLNLLPQLGKDLSQDQVDEFLSRRIPYMSKDQLTNTKTTDPTGMAAQEFLKETGYSVTEYFDDATTGFRAVALRNEKQSRSNLAFAGTNDLKDVLDDLVGKGVGDRQMAGNSVWIEKTLNRMNRESEIVQASGHSLGGALAQATAALFGDKLDSIKTFNSPGVTEEQIKQFAAMQPKPDVKHFINRRDVVSTGGAGFIDGSVEAFQSKKIRSPIAAHTDALLDPEKMERVSLTLEQLNDGFYRAFLMTRNIEQSIRWVTNLSVAAAGAIIAAIGIITQGIGGISLQALGAGMMIWASVTGIDATIGDLLISIKNAAFKTISFIGNKISGFVSWLGGIKTMILHALAENSPGLTSMIRDAWRETIDYMFGRITSVVGFVKDAGQKIQSFLADNPLTAMSAGLGFVRIATAIVSATVALNPLGLALLGVGNILLNLGTMVVGIMSASESLANGSYLIASLNLLGALLAQFALIRSAVQGIVFLAFKFAPSIAPVVKILGLVYTWIQAGGAAIAYLSFNLLFLEGVLTDIANIFDTIFNGIITVIVASVDRTLSYVANRITGFVGWLGGIKTMILHALAENSPGLTSAIREKWNITIGSIKGGIGSLVDSARKVGGKIARELMKPLEIVKKFGSEAKRKTENLYVDSGIKLLHDRVQEKGKLLYKGSGLREVNEGVQDLKNTLSREVGLRSFRDDVNDLFTAFYRQSGLRDFIEDVSMMTKHLYRESGMQHFALQMTNKFKDLYHKSGLASFIEPILNLVEVLHGSVGIGALGKAFEGLGQGFTTQDLIDGFQDFKDHPLLTIGSKIQAAWQKTVTFIQRKLGVFVDFVKGLKVTILHALAENSPGLTTKIRDSWAHTIDFIGGGIGKVVGFISRAGRKIGELIRDNPFNTSAIILGFLRVGVAIVSVTAALNPVGLMILTITNAVLNFSTILVGIGAIYESIANENYLSAVINLLSVILAQFALIKLALVSSYSLIARFVPAIAPFADLGGFLLGLILSLKLGINFLVFNLFYIAEIMGEINTVASTIFSFLSSSIKTATKAIIDIVTWTAKLIPTLIKTVISGISKISAFILDLPALLVKALSGTVTFIFNAIGAMFKGVRTTSDAIARMIGNLSRTLFDTALGLFDIFLSLPAFAIRAIDTVVRAFEMGIAEIIRVVFEMASLVIFIPIAIARSFAGLIDSILGTEVAQEVTTKGTTMIEELISSIQTSILNGFIRLSNFRQSLFQNLTETMGKIRGMIVGGVQAIGRAIFKLASKIYSFIGNLFESIIRRTKSTLLGISRLVRKPLDVVLFDPNKGAKKKEGPSSGVVPSTPGTGRRGLLRVPELAIPSGASELLPAPPPATGSTGSQSEIAKPYQDNSAEIYKTLGATEKVTVGIVKLTVIGVRKVISLIKLGFDYLATIPRAVDRILTRALENMDFFSFLAIAISGFPAFLMLQLRPTAMQVVPELLKFMQMGIPRGLIFALPAIVTVAVSTGFIKGLQNAAVRIIQATPDFLHRIVDWLRVNLSSELQIAIDNAVNSIIHAGVDVAADELFNFGDWLDEIDRTIESVAGGFAKYITEMGDISVALGQKISTLIEPLVKFRLFKSLPSTLATLAGIIPLIRAVKNFAADSALKTYVVTIRGEVGKLVNLVSKSFKYISKAGLALGRLFVNKIIAPFSAKLGTALGVNISIVDVESAKVAMKAVSGVVQASTRSLFLDIIPAQLARIPFIGNFLAQAFTVVNSAVRLFLPKILRSVIEFLYRILPPGLRGAIFSAFKGVGKLILTLLNPMSIVKFLATYLRTEGFRTIFKRGLFAINPLDLLLSAKWGKSQIFELPMAALRLGRGIVFPKNVVEKKMTEYLQVLADPLARARAGRLGIMVSRMEILSKQSKGVLILVKALEGLMILNPIVQALGAIVLAMGAWYVILKPLNQEVLQAIANVEILGISLAPLATTIRIIRFLVVDGSEAIVGAIQRIPGAIRAVAMTFNILGKALGITVGFLSEVVRQALNVTKYLIINPAIFFLVLAPLHTLELSLIAIREILKWLVVEATEWQAVLNVLVTEGFFAFLGAAFKQVGRDFGKLGRSIAHVFGGIWWVAKRLFSEVIELLGNVIYALVHFDQTLGKISQTVGGFATLIKNNYKGILAVVALIVGPFLAASSTFGVLAYSMIALFTYVVLEFNNGFKYTKWLIDALLDPIALVRMAIEALEKSFDKFLPKSFSTTLAMMTEGIIKALPLITLALFGIGLVLRKNISSAFSFVIQSGMKFVGVILRAVDAMKELGRMTNRGLDRTGVTMAAAQGTHAVRGSARVLGMKNPLAYSTDPQSQAKAVAVGDQLKMAKELRKYQKLTDKETAKRIRRQEKEYDRQLRNGSAQQKHNLLGDLTFDPETGQVEKRMPRLEEYTDRFGRKKYRTTEFGKHRMRQEMLASEEGQQARERNIEKSGLSRKYRQVTGKTMNASYAYRLDADSVDRRLGFAAPVSSDTGLRTEVGTALKNLHKFDNVSAMELRSQYLYVDVLHVKNADGGINQEARDLGERLKNIGSDKSLPKEVRDLAKNAPSPEAFSAQVRKSIRDRKSHEVSETFTDINTETASAFGLTPDSHGNYKGSGDHALLKYSSFASRVEQAQKDGDSGAIDKIVAELTAHYIKQQNAALKHAAQKYGVPEAAISGRPDGRPIPTGPMGIARQALGVGADEASALGAGGALGVASRALGIAPGVRVVRNNTSIDGYALKLERDALAKKAEQERIRAAGERKRRRSLSNQGERQNFDPTDVAQGARQQQVLDAYLKTGKHRFMPDENAYMPAMKVLGGSFNKFGNASETSDFRQKITSNLSPKELDTFRKFIRDGANTDAEKASLKAVIETLQNAGVNISGNDADKKLQTLENFRSTLGDTPEARQDVFSLLGTPDGSIKSTREDREGLAESLNVSSLRELDAGISNKNLFRNMEQGVEDYFLGIKDKIAGTVHDINRANEEINDLPDTRVNRFLNPIKKSFLSWRMKIVNAQTGFWSGIEKKTNGGIRALERVYDSIETVQVVGKFAANLKESEKNILKIGKRYKGKEFKNAKSFTQAMDESLKRKGFSDDVADRDRIIAQFLKPRAGGTSIGKLLESRVDPGAMSALAEAYADAVGISVSDARKILSNKNVTNKMQAPIQARIIALVPKLGLAIARDVRNAILPVAGLIGGGLGFVIKGAYRLVAPMIGKTVAKGITNLGQKAAEGFRYLADETAYKIGANPISWTLRKTAGLLEKWSKGVGESIQKEVDAAKANRGQFTSFLVDKASRFYSIFAGQLDDAGNRVAGTSLWAKIKGSFGSFMGKVKNIFKKPPGPPGNGSSDDPWNEPQNPTPQKKSIAQKISDRLRQNTNITESFEGDILQGYNQRQEKKATKKEYLGMGEYKVVKEFVPEVQGKIADWIDGAASKASSAMGKMVAPTAVQRTGSLSDFGASDNATNLRNIVGGVSYDEMMPKYKAVFAELKKSAAAAGSGITHSFFASAMHIGSRWKNMSGSIVGGLRGVLDFAKNKFKDIKNLLSSNSPGPTQHIQDKWSETEENVVGNMNGMLSEAETVGEGIADAMGGAADAINEGVPDPDEAESKLSRITGSFWKSGMAMGAAVSAAGMAGQTIAYSLSNMGFIEADGEIMNFVTSASELVTMVGAAGAVLAPLIEAVLTLVPALGALATGAAAMFSTVGTVAAGFFGITAVGFAPVLIGIGAIVAAVGGIYLAFKYNFLGITTLAKKTGQLLGFILAGPIEWLNSAWDKFYGKFGDRLDGLLNPAKKVAQGLINALNHNPTEVIPRSWDKATTEIEGHLHDTEVEGKAVGENMARGMQPALSMMGSAGSNLAGLETKSYDSPAPINNLIASNHLSDTITNQGDRLYAMAFKEQQILGKGVHRGVDSLVARSAKIDGKLGGLSTGVSSLKSIFSQKATEINGSLLQQRDLAKSLLEKTGAGEGGAIKKIGAAVALKVVGLSLLGYRILNGVRAIRKLMSKLNFSSRNRGGGLGRRNARSGLGIGAFFNFGTGVGKSLRPFKEYLPILSLVSSELGLISTILVGLSYLQSGFPAITAGLKTFALVTSSLGTIIVLLEVFTKNLNVVGTILGSFYAVFRGFKGFFAALFPGIDIVRDINNYLLDLTNTIKDLGDRGEQVGRMLGNAVRRYLIDPINEAKEIWTAFVDWFSKLPLISQALRLGNGMINALNHNPTVAIPQSWDKATTEIEGHLHATEAAGKAVGENMADNMQPALSMMGSAGSNLAGLETRSYDSPAPSNNLIASNHLSDTITNQGDRLYAVATTIGRSIHTLNTSPRFEVASQTAATVSTTQTVTAAVGQSPLPIQNDPQDVKSIVGIRSGSESQEDLRGELKERIKKEARIAFRVFETVAFPVGMAHAAVETAKAIDKNILHWQPPENYGVELELLNPIQAAYTSLRNFTNREAAFRSDIEKQLKASERDVAKEITEGANSQYASVRSKYQGYVNDKGEINDSGRVLIEQRLTKQVTDGTGVMSADNLTQTAGRVGLSKRQPGLGANDLAGVALKYQDDLNALAGFNGGAKVYDRSPNPINSGETNAEVGLTESADKARGAWGWTLSFIQDRLKALVPIVSEQGYELQKGISEGSPGPTKFIRDNWAKTTGFIGDTINAVVADTRAMSRKMKHDLSFAEIVRGNVTEVRNHLVLLSAGVKNFAIATFTSVKQWKFDDLKASAEKLGEVLKFSFTAGAASLGSLIKTTLLYGIVSLGAFSPVLVVMGAIAGGIAIAAFGTAVLVANFLGLRSIIKGLLQIAVGGVKTIIGTLTSLIMFVDGLQMVVRGLVMMVLGDKTLLVAGIDRIRQSGKFLVSSLVSGFKLIGKGILNVLRGPLIAFSQIFGISLERMNQGFRAFVLGCAVLLDRLFAYIKTSMPILGIIANKAGVVALKVIGFIRTLLGGVKRTKPALQGVEVIFGELIDPVNRVGTGLATMNGKLTMVSRSPVKTFLIQTLKLLYQVAVFVSKVISRLVILARQIIQLFQAFQSRRRQLTGGVQAIEGSIHGVGGALSTVVRSPFQRFVLRAISLLNTVYIKGQAIARFIFKLSGTITQLFVNFRRHQKQLTPGIRAIEGGTRNVSSALSTVVKSPFQRFMINAISRTGQLIALAKKIFIRGKAIGRVIGTLGGVIVRFFAGLFGQESKLESFVSGFKEIWGKITGYGEMAVDKITVAWQTFRSKFSGIIDPIVAIALDIAQKLINALNHNPTVKIPTAWDKAVKKIETTLNKLVPYAAEVGRLLKVVFSRTFNAIGEFITGFVIGFGSQMAKIQFDPAPFIRLTEAIKDFGAQAETVFQTVKGLITGVSFAPITQETDKAGEKIITLRNLGELVGTSLGLMVRAVGTALGLVADILTVVTKIATVAVGAIDNVLKFGRGLVSGFIIPIAPALERAKPAMQTLATATESVYNAVKGLIGSALVQFFTNNSDRGGELKAKFDSIVVAVKDFTQSLGTAEEIGKRIGLAVGGAIADLISAFSRLIGFIADFKADGLNAGTVVKNSVGAVSQKLGRLNKVFKLFGKNNKLKTEAGATEAAWVGSGNKIETSLAVITTASVETSQKMGLLSTAADGVQAAWSKTGGFISKIFGGLRKQSKQTGEELQHNTSENSPGPTFMIRKNWGHTGGYVTKEMHGLADTSKLIGRRIKDNLRIEGRNVIKPFRRGGQLALPPARRGGQLALPPARRGGQLALPPAERGGQLALRQKRVAPPQGDSSSVVSPSMNAVGESTNRAANSFEAAGLSAGSMRSATMSLGAALSNFAPQLATPIFVANDLYDAFKDISAVLPGVAKFLRHKGSAASASAIVETQANNSVIASNQLLSASRQQAAAINLATDSSVVTMNAQVVSSELAVATTAANSSAIQISAARASASAEVTSIGLIARLKATLIGWYRAVRLYILRAARARRATAASETQSNSAIIASNRMLSASHISTARVNLATDSSVVTMNATVVSSETAVAGASANSSAIQISSARSAAISNLAADSSVVTMNAQVVSSELAVAGAAANSSAIQISSARASASAEAKSVGLIARLKATLIGWYQAAKLKIKSFFAARSRSATASAVSETQSNNVVIASQRMLSASRQQAAGVNLAADSSVITLNAQVVGSEVAVAGAAANSSAIQISAAGSTTAAEGTSTGLISGFKATTIGWYQAVRLKAIEAAATQSNAAFGAAGAEGASTGFISTFKATLIGWYKAVKRNALSASAAQSTAAGTAAGIEGAAGGIISGVKAFLINMYRKTAFAAANSAAGRSIASGVNAANEVAHGTIVLGMQAILQKGYTLLMAKAKAAYVVLAPFKTVIIAIGLAIAAVYLIYRYNLFGIMDILKDLKGTVMAVWRPIQKILIIAWQFINRTMTGVIKELVKTSIELGRAISGVIGGLFKAAVGLIVPVMELINLFTGKKGEQVAKKSFLTQISDLIIGIFKVVTAIVKAVGEQIAKLVDFFRPVLVILGETLISTLAIFAAILAGAALISQFWAIVSVIYAAIVGIPAAIAAIFSALSGVLALSSAFVPLVPLFTFLGGLITSIGLALAAAPLGTIAAGIAVIIGLVIFARPLFAFLVIALKAIYEGFKILFVTVFDTVKGELGPMMAAFKEMGRAIIEPFQPLLDMFGGGGGGGGGGGFLKTALTIFFKNVVFGFKVAAKLLSWTIKAFSIYLIGIIKLLTIAVKIVMYPIKGWILIVKVFLPMFIAGFKMGFSILVAIVKILLTIPIASFKILQNFRNILAKNKGFINVLKAVGRVIRNSVLAPFLEIWNVVKSIFGLVGNVGGAIGRMLSFESGPRVDARRKGTPDFGRKDKAAPVQQLSTGGPVKGIGSTTSDSNPAMLSKDEFVVRASSAKGNMALLEHLNEFGEVPQVDPGGGGAVEFSPITPEISVATAPRLNLPSKEEIQKLSSKSKAKVVEPTININFGDIVVQGGSSPDMVRDFLNAVGPQLQSKIKEALRDMTERTR